MVDESSLDDHLAGLAAEGRRSAVPLAAERIRVRGDRRRRRKRAAQLSGGVLLAAAVAVGGLSLVRPGPEQAPAAAKPTASSTPRFVPPTPSPGEEYASEIGYVYDATVVGDAVRVTVEQLRTERGRTVPTGVVHQVTLSPQTSVEVEQLAGGKPGDVRLEELTDRLRGGPRWVFAVDYDGEGRVRSLREASWLTVD